MIAITILCSRTKIRKINIKTIYTIKKEKVPNSDLDIKLQNFKLFHLKRKQIEDIFK